MPWNKYTEDSDDTRMVFTHPDHPGWRMVEKHPELGPGLRILDPDDRWDIEADRDELTTVGYDESVRIPWVFLCAMVNWFGFKVSY